MGTPHNNAYNGDFAKTVLMPGDPLRAKFIAETFLENVRMVTDVRNVYGFTGTYHGKQVSVMASGMGMPSMGIYSYELFTQYDVDTIIRIGTAGAYTEQLKLYDVVLVESAWSESSFARVQNGCEDDILYASREVNVRILAKAEEKRIPIKRIRVHSTDVFYTESNVDDYHAVYEKHGCECVEMESFALFHNANVLGKKAACLLTISDCFPSQEKATPKERQEAFLHMIEVALEAAVE